MSLLAPTTGRDPARAAAARAESLAYCRALTRSRAGNFYYGLRLAPEPRRSALYAVYAWTRWADDLADDSPSPAAARSALAAYRVQTRAVFANTDTRYAAPRDLPVDARLWPAFAGAVQEYQLQERWCLDLLDGMESDLDQRTPATLDELLAYCDRVAGTVGCMCVAVWGLRDAADRSRAFALAQQRGRAFQLTNVLRDLAADAALTPTRCYVPLDLLARHNLTPAALTGWHDPAAARAVVAALAGEARAAYAASTPLEGLIDPACVRVLRALTEIYRGLLERLAATPEHCVRVPALSLSPWVKVTIAARALLSGR